MSDRARRGPISLADALRVEARLRPGDDRTREAIERLLGAERAAPPASLAPSVGPWRSNEPVPAPGPGGPMPDAPASPPRAPGAATPPRPRLRGTALIEQHLGRVSFTPPSWAGEPSAFAPAAGSDASAPPPPLFAPGHARAILGATLATFRPGSEVDVARAAATLAAGRRLSAIPYRRVPTLRRGAQVLVDRGPAMDPLHEDVRHLLRDLELVLGRGHLEVLSFSHCPAATVDRHRGVWSQDSGSRSAWRAPGRGVPILIVSDFAMAPPVDDEQDATVDEWLGFVRQVRAARCHPVGLVPYAPSRWSPALVRLMPFVHWSERTTARQVLRALREARFREAFAEER